MPVIVVEWVSTEKHWLKVFNKAYEAEAFINRLHQRKIEDIHTWEM